MMMREVLIEVNADVRDEEERCRSRIYNYKSFVKCAVPRYLYLYFLNTKSDREASRGRIKHDCIIKVTSTSVPKSRGTIKEDRRHHTAFEINKPQ